MVICEEHGGLCLGGAQRTQFPGWLLPETEGHIVMKLMARGPSTPSLMAVGIEKWGFLV